MSSGIVVCSACKREVHQNGAIVHGSRCECPRSSGWCTTGWTHCEDKTPRCAGATSDFPESTAEIVGRWCGIDE